MKINLLFIINGLRRGGMERQLVESIKHLKEIDKTNIYLIVLNNPGPYSDEVESLLSKPIEYLDRRKSKVFNTVSAINKIIRRSNIDIIHVQDSFSALYALPASFLTRTVFVNGMIRHAGTSKGFEYIIGLILLKFSNVVVANSIAGLKYYKSKGEVIYNVINRGRFKASKASIRRIVMNANFNSFKDQKTFIDACVLLFSEGKIDHVGLIGNGPNLEYYKSYVKTLGLYSNFTFYGRINNVEEVLMDYGIGVLCSTKKYKEGVSNSILEYMGSGLISVGSDIGATNEIIDDNVNGYLFDPENAEELYEVLKRIIENPENNDIIKKRALLTLEEKFDATHNTKQLIKIYKNIVK